MKCYRSMIKDFAYEKFFDYYKSIEKLRCFCAGNSQGIGQGVRPDYSDDNTRIGQGTRPIYNYGDQGIGQGARIDYGDGEDLLV
ncbi:toxin-antitoxin system, antitoxin component, Xre domain protein [Dictyocaulus viviparus]|uniref:Toxin-antitoxin system, antitoxin component, Xre domain protein n=1 Tax=Dictyocaulus viviparus TaxID=29172 RepID=A0A0D8XGK6_DICVI|nr:toxin-antitoxin system, antitoxin component, Xre domain protein [Dictyocaulus viviparus]